ncbi:trans-Golgi network-localized SYP41-interacting protein 1 isoform X2 [Corylus avellana]|uniref:trans-Golgi network-localized SYP41-interacting protein 1 isoform X2 n=1 Tax=Corylus avellana TaxID=13451 RepID=UPI00286C4FE4|nr:trans-Golgi network-localized SYP41-interacting protein 1 isoform X2 [Corylus avellana]
MDKNKNRTDLLAAGRKKLQQFRQKKDSKGSVTHGKSSKKFGKSEQHEADADADASSTTPIPTASSQVTERKIAPHDAPDLAVVDSSVPQSMGVGEPNTSLMHLREDQVTDEADGLDLRQIDRSNGTKLEGDGHLPMSEHGESSETLSRMASVETCVEEASCEAEQTGKSGEVSASGGATLSDGFSASVLALHGADRNNEIDLEGDRPLPLSEHGEIAETLSRIASLETSMEEASHEMVQIGESGEVSASDGGTLSAGFSASVLPLNEADRSSEVELEGYKQLTLSEHDESAETLSRIPSVEISAKEASIEAEQMGESGEVCASDSVTLSAGFSASVLDLNKADRSSEIEAEGDRQLPFSEHGETAETLPKIVSVETSMEEASHESVEVPASGDATLSDGFSASVFTLNEEDGISAVNPAMTNRQREEIVPGSSYEENSDMLFQSGDYGQGREEKAQAVTDGRTAAEGYDLQYLPDGLFTRESKILERPFETEMASSAGAQTVSPVADASAISLSQLKEVISRLNEEEFRFLLKSRESVSNAELGTCSLIFAESGFMDLLQRLKEELFLTHFTKDFFHLQLAEQSEQQMELDHQCHQLVDEISLLNASLDEFREKNQFLAEEFAQCRSELQVVTSGRVELEDQFRIAKAEVEDLSSRACGLQSSLERSERDLLSLSTELADCKSLVADLQVENTNLDGTVVSVTEERKKLVEEKEFLFHENVKLSKELADSKNVAAALQFENSNLIGSLSSVTVERKKLEEEKEHHSLENEKLSIELADCKGLVAALQVENTNLNGNIALVTQPKSKLEEDKEYLNLENETLTSKLLALQEQLSAQHGERKKFEVDLKEMTMQLEQLTEENFHLHSSLVIFKATIREIASWQTQIPCQAGEAGNEISLEVRSRGHESGADYDSHQIRRKQDGEVYSPVLEKPVSDGLAVEPPLEQEVSDDSYSFFALKRHVEEAEKILHKLEKAVEGVHSHAASFSRSAGKGSTPGVSKLIQAFESKVHVDENEAEERALTENQSPADPFMVTKEQTGILRALLKQLVLEAEHATVLLKEERDQRNIADVIFRELRDEHEAVKEHSDNLEAANIELGVLYEALKQHVGYIEARNGELGVLYESLKQQDINLKAENSELGEKLRGYQLRISELQSQLYDLQQGSNEATSVISNQLENLQKEVAERVLLLEQDWNSTVAQILEIVGKLDDSIGEFFPSTISIGTHGGLDISSRVAASVNAATKVIEALQGELQAAQTNHEAICTSYKELNEKCDDLHGKNELANGILHKMQGRLMELVISSCGSGEESERNIPIEKVLDPLDDSKYMTLLGQMENSLDEKRQLESVNNKLTAELINRVEEFEELKRRCLDPNTVHKLIEDVGSVLKLEEADINLDRTPALHLELLVSLLVQKFKAADVEVGLSKEKFASKVMEMTELQDKIHQLEASTFEHENEILILKDSLRLLEEALIAARSELRDKISELEQTEQRVSSIREKLSIAVAKGKGLVVQRDGLKQSLAETSSELERCLQELQLKDSKIQEVETKLKTYSEAGERVEALESELSYIRNSATALRESFLLKDSVLQRIEEILEDLDLPEHFHSRDIIEKIDWLARAAAGNSVPLLEEIGWQGEKSSAGGGSYSDAAFVVSDAWKDDVQPSSSSGDDLRRKFEELQNRLYGLAEQNEMLEQSLMERNNLVQRLEELLDRIDMPLPFRSVEPEDRIEWLGKALSEAQHDRNSFQQKIDNFENYCGSLSADLEDSQHRVSDLEADLEAVTQEREHLSERLEILTNEHEKLSSKTAEFELEKKRLQNEVDGLKEKLIEKLGNEEQIASIEGKIRRLQDLVSDALQESGPKDLVSGSDIHCLEELLRKLIENYGILSSMNPVLGDVADRQHAENADATLAEARSIDTLDSREPNIAVLKKELEEAMCELVHEREEKDRYMDKQQSLVCEVEALSRKRDELQELLSQEEQKSASVREKFSVAVRKGKSLLQQRDGLKQTIEEKNTEVEHLKSEITHRENALAEYEQKFRDLSTFPGRVEVLESECLVLRNQLTEAEHYLHEKGHVLSMLLNTLNGIDVGDDVSSGDSVERLELLGKLFSDLRSAVACSDQELRKSKRAAELLLAELNEVQERNDVLQEELAKAANEVAELTKERDLAEAAKLEAISRLEKLSTVRSEERKNQLSEFMGIKSGLNQLRKGFRDANYLLADVFSKDLEYLHNLEVGIESCLKANNGEQVAVPLFRGSDAIISSSLDNKEMDSWSDSERHGHFDENVVFELCHFVAHHLHEFLTEIGDLKEKLSKHSVSLHEQDSSLSKLVAIVHGEMTSQKESFEAMKRDIVRIESIEKEKDMELILLRRNIAVLYEACASSVMEIENRRVDLVGNIMAAADLGLNLKSTTFTEGELSFSGQAHFSSEESIRTMADRLVLAVRDFASLKAETVVGNQKEMKMTIANLQKELHEKDIQKERICMELVTQIKEAEAAATSYSLDLQSSKTQVHDLEKQVEVIEGERNLLEQRVKELEDTQAASTELQDRVRSLTGVLAAKDQEIEALMQALDEEEVQMEDLTNKIEDLEKVVQQKNLDLKNLEGSRGKALKKLSVTVTKFDELHHLSESLLAEVEKLQAQVLDRDAEISFLRQEVTRCTNDVLVASQMSSKKTLDEIHEFLTWFDSMIAQVGVHDVHLDDKNSSDVHEHKEILQKKVMSIISELEDLLAVAQSKDALLQVERSKVEELTCKEEFLEKSLREKESRLNLLEGVGDSERATSMTSEILEVEPMINKWTVPATSIAPQVRSLRKGNNDQVAIAIDMDPGSSGRLEDEDDDKVHGFKSLATSRIVPRFTRRVTDMIDGLWVSCDRALMRQPALRLGIIIYWAILHALLATVVV